VEVVGCCCTCVAVVVGLFVVELVVDCPVLVPVPAQAETNNMTAIAAVPTSRPWKRVDVIFRIVLSVLFNVILISNLLRDDMNFHINSIYLIRIRWYTSNLG
jgi:hypothetical protein